MLGKDHPRLSLRQPGRWAQTDSHTLVFRPSGDGAPFNADETIRFPTPVRVLGGTTWHVAPAEFLRLQQLLAQEGYLPVTWSPAAADVPLTKRAELAAATAAPDGNVRLALPEHAVRAHDALEPRRAGHGHARRRDDVPARPRADGRRDRRAAGVARRDRRRDRGQAQAGGYSYVYVHRNVPQLLTLWHNGHVVLTSPGNTGVPAAPTALGTWPVFEHIPVGRMSGRNPNGTRYDDPGIRWISYFHGGEALHAFNRASFGTPQSLGCVELPLDQAAKVWPYTPIGTLVTIED